MSPAPTEVCCVPAPPLPFCAACVYRLLAAATSLQATRTQTTSLARQSAGTWETRAADPDIDIPGLQKGSGVAVFQLKTSGSRKEGVHDVEVPVLLRAAPVARGTPC